MGENTKKVTVICNNPFHKRGPGGVRFRLHQASGTARAEVDPETAEELLEEDPEAYRCPDLERRPTLRKVETIDSETTIRGEEIKTESLSEDEVVDPADTPETTPEDDGEGDDEADDPDAERGRAIARLTQVNGIGPVTAKALYEAGVTSIERLAEVQEYEGALADVAKEAEVSEEQLKGWSEQATALLEDAPDE